MCGIVGQVAAVGASADRAAVERGCDALFHRGPDGYGIADYGRAVLGHRRLSIIDLPLSTQPWTTPDGRYTLVFNGEIYNYIELREQLAARGHRFTSNGDTEVLMQMFVEYGIECLQQLNGMFAFAVWDAVEQTLLLARDRIGKKPIYYAIYDGGIAFASECGALQGFQGIDFSVDLAAIHDYFAYQFIPDSSSIYRGVHKLPAASYLVFGRDEPKVERYWSIEWGTADWSEGAAVQQLRDLVDDAVRLRLRSDVPLGVFLSGGLDSSVILQSMVDQGADVHSYTIGFKEKSYDESSQARDFAALRRVDHHEKLIDFDALDIVRKVSAALSEPFADPSTVPVWLLCQYARESVTVALSGDGADELFGGYQRYRAMRFLQSYDRLPKLLRQRLIEPLVGRLREPSAYYGSNWRKKLKLFLRLARRMRVTPRDMLPQIYDIDERRRLLNTELVDVIGHDHVSQFGLERLDPVERMMLADIQAYLSGDILTKVDRMSMAHSLEVRSPLLDYRIVEFACGLGARWKLHQGQTKYLLRRAYGAELPAAVLRRGKHGFDVPVGAWFRTELKDLFGDAVLGVACPDYFNRDEILALWQAHQQGRGDFGVRLWALLVYFLWLDRQSC